MKTCSKCKQIKDLENFYRNRSCIDGRAHRCKDCSNEATVSWQKRNKEKVKSYRNGKNGPYWRKWRYGITQEQYETILSSQNNSCKICQKPHDPSEKMGRLRCDHDHVTGLLRGLLCHPCNVALGMVRDDIDVLAKCIAYLNHSRGLRASQILQKSNDSNSPT